MSKPEFPKYKPMVSPKGVAVFPWLTRPDTKFDDDGVYHTGLAFDPSDPQAAEFQEKLEAMRDECFEAYVESAPKAKKKQLKKTPVFKPEFDSEGEETGRIVFNFKTKATKKVRDRMVPKTLNIFDAKKNPHPNNIPVYGGSVIRVAFRAVPNPVKGELFLTLYIEAIQVISLETSGGGAGMFDEEDGYQASESDADAFDDDDSPEYEGDDDDDEDDLY